MNLHAERGCTRLATPGRFRSFAEVEEFLRGLDLSRAREITGELRRQSRRNEILVTWLFWVIDAMTSCRRLSGFAARLAREAHARTCAILEREERGGGLLEC